MVEVTRKCPFCGTHTTLDLPAEGVARRNAGALIQDAFPDLSPDYREVLVTGLCLRCQGNVFGEEDVA